MAKAIHLEIEDSGDAEELTARLRLNGFDAASLRPIVGPALVRVPKPPLRRTRSFAEDVETTVRRWLEEAPVPSKVTLRAGRRDVEIDNPAAPRSAAAHQASPHVHREPRAKEARLRDAPSRPSAARDGPQRRLHQAGSPRLQP